MSRVARAVTVLLVTAVAGAVPSAPAEVTVQGPPPMAVRAATATSGPVHCAGGAGAGRAGAQRPLLHCRFVHLVLTRVVLTADAPDGPVTVHCARADLPGVVDVDLRSVTGRLAGLLPVRWDAALPLPGFSIPPMTLTDVTATADSFTAPGGRLLDVVQQ